MSAQGPVLYFYTRSRENGVILRRVPLSPWLSTVFSSKPSRATINVLTSMPPSLSLIICLGRNNADLSSVAYETGDTRMLQHFVIFLVDGTLGSLTLIVRYYACEIQDARLQHGRCWLVSRIAACSSTRIRTRRSRNSKALTHDNSRI